MNKFLDKIVKPVYHKLISEPIFRYRFKHNPQKIATDVYKRVFGKDADLENPKDLIEKILWLQFNTDTSLWTLCADKYRVRSFVEGRGYGDQLCKLYGMWENAADIDFDALPNQFVLKTNHGCGQIFLVKDKKTADLEGMRKMLGKWLKQGYGYAGAQMHYTRIKPCIIAEEMLPCNEGEKSMIDYKIWCLNGKPRGIMVCFDRSVEVGHGSYSLSMYDTEWNNISDFAFNKNNKHYSGKEVPKPLNLDKMLEMATELSQGFPQVRVDLYNVNGKIYFGEMTFTTGYGYFSREYYEYLGSKITLPAIGPKAEIIESLQEDHSTKSGGGVNA